MKKSQQYLLILLCIGIAIVAYRHWAQTPIADAGLREIDNGDAQFWLMQGGANDRLMPCTVYYRFDTPLDEALVRDRLQELVSAYAMFNRNVVEFDGLPYWQQAEVDWSENLRLLGVDEDLESVRQQAEIDVSQSVEPGEGLPLFRAYLSSDRKQLVFVWHHVISDLEGMFNKHARHLFREQGERTQFGYQVARQAAPAGKVEAPEPALNVLESLASADRAMGFTGANYAVTRKVLPVTDKALHALGERAGLPMSDIFSFMALRTATRYEALTNANDGKAMPVRPMLSPVSLRSSSLDMGEGNYRAVRLFPFVFPLENTPDMHQRIVRLEPTSSSYDTAGKWMKLARRAAFLEPALRNISLPDYISNYFPLADSPLKLGDARLVSHSLRVPMVPFERTKFAWSNYNGEVQLFLHTDPVLVNKQRMLDAFELASDEVMDFLSDNARPH